MFPSATMASLIDIYVDYIKLLKWQKKKKKSVVFCIGRISLAGHFQRHII